MLLPMEVTDLDDVAALEAEAQAFPWQRANFSDSLLAGHWSWILRRGSEVLGFAVVMGVLDEAHLLNVAVAPRHQGHGLGARLLRHAMDYAASQGMQRMFLEVRASNSRAEALYQHYGFQQIGCRKAYYPAEGGREDALVYSRSLEDSRS